MKRCTKCKQEKHTDGFPKNKNYKDGFHTQCKQCTIDWYKINKKEQLDRSKKYYENNKEEHIERSKKYKQFFIENNPNYYLEYRKNKKEQINKYFIQYYEENKKEHLERVKKWHSEHKDYSKQHRIKNIETYRENSKKWSKNKRKTDYNYKLTENLRCRFYQALKLQKISKDQSILDIIGGTIEQCKQHLESQFKPEMNWDNHGSYWEIDHIKPCSSFDLTDIKQQKQCFHYTNLQPLFKTTEIAKQNGYENETGNRNKGNR